MNPTQNGEKGAVPTKALRAFISLHYPDEMTPEAKRHLEAMCDAWDRLT